MDETAVNDVKIDWTYRGGGRDSKKPRPIIVKFSDFQTREKVRVAANHKRDELKQNHLGISIQWPQAVREKRRKLYPVMQRFQNEGKTVRMVGDKLYVNGQLYREPETDVNQTTRMETGR